MADTFTVLGQEPKTIISPGGVIEQAVEITFQTKPSGVTGRVRIPQSMLSADAVRSAIARQAALIEEIQGM